jgi:RNA polymerase sigma-70 factor (ECF subfamily)
LAEEEQGKAVLDEDYCQDETVLDSQRKEPPVEVDDSASSCERLSVEQVFHIYAARVYTVARRMVGNEADAEDVTQEVLLQVVRYLDTFRGEATMGTWLYRITTNAALALRRKRATYRERQMSSPLEQFLGDGSHARPVVPWRDTPDNQALDQELRERIEAAIANLPPLYRATYVLAEVEGLSNAEVGEVLGLSLPAVKSRLHRSRLMLRQALAPYFEEPAGDHVPHSGQSPV